MATYVNNLRLKEIATGAEEGTWGDSTNANLGLIADAFGSGTEAITTNANTHTTTIADGAADEGRAILLKYTGALDSDCTITIAPNTINKLWFIENATTDSGSSGPYNIIISQGSGANITIANGNTAAVMTDGAGATAAVLDAFADLELMTTLKVGGNTTVGGNATVSGALDLAGAANIDGVLDQNVPSTVMHNMTNTGIAADLSWSQRVEDPGGDYEIRSTTDAGITVKLALSLAHATGDATFAGDVVPKTDSAASLGLTGTRWDKVFADQLDVDATDDGFGAVTISNTLTTQYAKSGLTLGMDEVAANDIDSWHLFNQKGLAGAATGASDFFVRGYTKTNLDYINLIHADSSDKTLYFAASDFGTDAAIQHENWSVEVGTALHVDGALSKSSGSFKIDHPLELMKDTHHLVHSFIEGARADLIYRGSVQLSGGTATVDLDDAATMTHGTWELLCRDPQVWTQNEDGWTRVRGSVLGSTLTIVAEDGDCADTVSWLVVAERHDQHMMDTDWTDTDGRVLVEPTKDII